MGCLFSKKYKLREHRDSAGSIVERDAGLYRPREPFPCAPSRSIIIMTTISTTGGDSGGDGGQEEKQREISDLGSNIDDDNADADADDDDGDDDGD